MFVYLSEFLAVHRSSPIFTPAVPGGDPSSVVRCRCFEVKKREKMSPGRRNNIPLMILLHCNIILQATPFRLRKNPISISHSLNRSHQSKLSSELAFIYTSKGELQYIRHVICMRILFDLSSSKICVYDCRRL